MAVTFVEDMGCRKGRRVRANKDMTEQLIAGGQVTDTRAEIDEFGAVRCPRKDDGIRFQSVLLERSEELHPRRGMIEESGPLRPVEAVSGGQLNTGNCSNISISDFEARISGWHGNRPGFHVEQIELRRCLDEPVSAYWTIRYRDAVKHDVSSGKQTLAAGLKKALGDLASAELGNRSPIQDVRFVRIGIRAGKNDSCRLAVDIPDQRVRGREIPVSLERQKAEKVEMILE